MDFGTDIHSVETRQRRITVTHSALFGWITLALAAQLAAGLALWWWHHRAPRTAVASNTARHDDGSLFSREVLPFALALLALALATIAIDALLHLFDRVWVGRYLGIPGVLLIIGSFGYSLRKRKIIARGHPMTWLRVHERMAWSGSLLVLVHAGIHFNGLLAWLAVGAMLINVTSGLTGKYLLIRARRRLEASRQELRAEGLSDDAIEQRLHWDSLTLDLVRQWRVVHFPIALAFTVLALAHIVSTFLYWGWR